MYFNVPKALVVQSLTDIPPSAFTGGNLTEQQVDAVDHRVALLARTDVARLQRDALTVLRRGVLGAGEQRDRPISPAAEGAKAFGSTMNRTARDPTISDIWFFTITTVLQSRTAEQRGAATHAGDFLRSI